MRSSWMLTTVLLLSLNAASGCGGEALSDGVPVHDGVPVSLPSEAWEGTLRPVAIAAGPDGRVYVGDQGDRRIKIFDAEGRSVSSFGGSGSGPGELAGVQNLTVLDREIVVSDRQSGRLVRYDRDGTFVSVIPNLVSAEALGGLGPDRIVLAGSPAWAMSATLDPSAGILFEILYVTGEVARTGGERQTTSNPFAGHVRDFVVPAGSMDGSFLWLAYLNHPSVHRYSLADDETSVVERTLPFEWRELATDFEPSPESMAQGAEASPPFDIVTLDVATDRSDRAFVLTALSPTRAGNPPVSTVGVDVLDPREGWTDRIRLPHPASHIAVSPDGSRLYLLDESTAEIRVYGWEG